MEKCNDRALTALKGDLKSNIIFKNGLINYLETDAGGFMSRAEAQMVESKPSNAEQMGELILILQGKSNAAFGTFCQLLRKVMYGAWADELEKKARQFKEESGTLVL